MATPFGHTADGFETQFGTNHLGHFVLVNRIASLIRSGGRLINLSSLGPPLFRRGPCRSQLRATAYDPFVAYGRSKTANILFAVAFDQTAPGTRVRAVAVHPGVIHTELARHVDAARVQKILDERNKQLALRASRSPVEDHSQGAATSVWAAVAAPAEEIGGRYCEDCTSLRSRLRTCPPLRCTKARGTTRSIQATPKHSGKKSEELVGEKF